jgi:hypothetical protein
MSTNPPIVIPSLNNQNTGSVQTLPGVTVYSSSRPKSSLPADPPSGFNVASLITPSNLATLQSLKSNPQAFGEQLKEQGKQKIIQAIAESTLAKLLKEKANLIKEGIELDINHQLVLAKLELRKYPKKQYVNGVVTEIPAELSEIEYQEAVDAEDKNYKDAKKILQEKKDKNQEDLDKYYKDPFKEIKDKIKKRKEARAKRKSRTKAEKTKARKEKIKAVLKNTKKTLGPILTLLITNKVAEIVAQNDKIQKLINDTNAIILEANQSGDPLKLSNAKLARDNAIKVINDNIAKIQKVAETINKISVYINIFSLIVNIISSIPIPTSVPPGIGVPINLIMTLVKILDKANRILLMLSSLIPVALGILQKAIGILEDLKSQLLDIDGKLDTAAASGVPNLSLNLNSETGGITLGIVPSTEYKGFKFAIKEESGPKSLVVRGNKRHYAVAIDINNVEILTSDYSFTLDPNDLIDQLKLIIDRRKLFTSVATGTINTPQPENVNDFSQDFININSPESVNSLIKNTQQNQSSQAAQATQVLQNQIQSTATQTVLTTRPPLTKQQKLYYTNVASDSEKSPYDRQNARDILKRNYV